MARRPRSRASRAERRMLKERAASAIKHGLPVPTPLPARTRTAEVAARSSSGGNAASFVAEPGNRRMPLAVKLLGLGLLLLGVVYGLTLFRDHRSEADALRPASEGPAERSASSSEPESAAIAPAAQPAKASLNSGLPADLGAMIQLPGAASSSVPPRPRDAH